MDDDDGNRVIEIDDDDEEEDSDETEEESEEESEEDEESEFVSSVRVSRRTGISQVVDDSNNNTFKLKSQVDNDSNSNSNNNGFEIDGLYCPICMEAWTSGGQHQIWYPLSLSFYPHSSFIFIYFFELFNVVCNS